MNMSTVMKMAGYDGLPDGTELIQKQEAREAATGEGQKEQPMRPTNPDFPFSISRSLEGPGDQEIELAIEVKHYRPAGNNRGLDSRDPAFDGGEVDFGHAVVISTGKTIELTPMEWDAVETAFWNQ